MHADAGIGRARAAGDEGDTRSSRHRAVGAGHEGDPAFLTAGDDIDFGSFRQRVEHGEEAFPGHSEDPFAALLGEAFDQQRRRALSCVWARLIRHVKLSRLVRSGLYIRACKRANHRSCTGVQSLSQAVTAEAGQVSKG
jgi:hypothetical protein